MNLRSENPERELIEPAVRGTLNVMWSCVKAGTVKRVVLTSSAASISRTRLQGGDGHVLDEDCWSDVEFLRANKPPMWGYPVSKVLLEKEATRFAAEHGVSLAMLCPVITVGAAPAPNAVTSVPNCLSLLSGDEAEFAVLRGMERAAGTIALVHVDDVCRAELFLAEQEEEAAAATDAGTGGRYLCCGVNTTVLQLARFLEDKYPRYPVKTHLLSDDDQLLEKPRVILSSAKLVREGFEYKYKTLDEMYDDVVKYGKDLGILPN